MRQCLRCFALFAALQTCLSTMSAEAYQESQHFFVLWTGSQPPRALGQLLARSVLVHEEKWKSAKDGDGTKVSHENAVRSDQLVIASVPDSSDDTDSNGIKDSDEG